MLSVDMENLWSSGLEVGSYQWPFAISWRWHFIALQLIVIICKIMSSNFPVYLPCTKHSSKQFVWIKLLILTTSLWGEHSYLSIFVPSWSIWNESAICICISLPSGTSLAIPHSSLLSTELGSLCYTAVSSYFTHGGVYMSMLLFQFVSLSFPW